MIGLDTNVVVRLLTRDDPVQARRAADFIADQAARNEPVFISLVVLTETVWVLGSTYKYSHREIEAGLHGLLAADEFIVEQRDALDEALRLKNRGRADFADVFIEVANRTRGCSATATFDRRAMKHPGFVAL
ncbi:MAG: PIN domain-containing protein [Rhizomicrobium sp.]